MRRNLLPNLGKENSEAHCKVSTGLLENNLSESMLLEWAAYLIAASQQWLLS